MSEYVIGLDYGSDSARALVVDVVTGKCLASSVKEYPRWKKGLYCNPKVNMWRQHPKDYLEVLEYIVIDALSKCEAEVAPNVVGMAFDTTGSTPALVAENGQPLAMLPEYSENPNAMFVLWKDHTAMEEAREINEACRNSAVDYAKYEGGTYSPEWLWAKALHCVRSSPELMRDAYSVVECCEWLPAVLTGVQHSGAIVRSRCAYGHKLMWNEEWGGLPPENFFSRLDPRLSDLRRNMPDEASTADQPVGTLCLEWAERLGLSTDVVIAGGAIDCHVGAVGAGIKEQTLIRVIGTSTCDVLVASEDEIGDKCIKGICGQVNGSVIPGMIGLEAGQSAFGDVYAMFRRILEWPLRNCSGLGEEACAAACEKIIPLLTSEAERIGVSEDDMLATDWMNGRRSPDSDPSQKGTITGFTLGTTAPEIFRSLVEATAFGTRAIIDRFTEEGIRIDSVIGVGGIALKSPFVMQVMSDVIGRPIKVCKSDQVCALGAAMFAATAAGRYRKVEDAIAAMNSGFSKEYIPDENKARVYHSRYYRYLSLA